jgi:hypothetical protein
LSIPVTGKAGRGHSIIKNAANSLPHPSRPKYFETILGSA